MHTYLFLHCAVSNKREVPSVFFMNQISWPIDLFSFPSLGGHFNIAQRLKSGGGGGGNGKKNGQSLSACRLALGRDLLGIMTASRGFHFKLFVNEEVNSDHQRHFSYHGWGPHELWT